MRKSYAATLAGILSATLAVPTAVLFTTSANAATDPSTATMLQDMVVEEKLAHDVYETLGETYEARQFDRIANSEDRHQDAVRRLLDRYDVVDPTAGDAVGEFDDPAIQAMYDDLVAQGQVSLEAAAGVGITIEVMDIEDLDAALATDLPADVTRVFTSLRKGSTKHLAAFERLADGDTAWQGQGQGQKQGAGKGGPRR